MKSQGFLYFAEGDNYINQAERSISSLKKVMPKAKVALCTTTDEKISIKNVDETIKIEYDAVKHPKAGKIKSIKASPFEKTIFVDTDTIFVEDVSNIFDALNKFPVVLTHAPFRMNPSLRSEKLPTCFAQVNTGFVGFDFTKASVNDLVADWEKEFLENLDTHEYDQFSFNRVLYRSDIRFLTLPPEYNFRAEFSHQSKGPGMAVKMIHSHTVNEMDDTQLSSLVSALSKKDPATLFKRGGNYLVENHSMPGLQAVEMLARILHKQSPSEVIRVTDIWNKNLRRTNLFQSTLKEIESLSDQIYLVQIGANDGSDDQLSKFIGRDKWASVLVEPQPDIFVDLEKLYGGQKNVQLVEAAISSEDGKLTMHRPAKADDSSDAAAARKASRIATIIPERGQVSRMKDSSVSTMEVTALSWQSLLKQTGFPRIDVLCIDTEGAELLLLNALFEALDKGDVTQTPLLIHYEERHLLPFEKDQLQKELRKRKYSLVEERFPLDTTAIHRPSLFKLKGPLPNPLILPTKK